MHSVFLKSKERGFTFNTVVISSILQKKNKILAHFIINGASITEKKCGIVNNLRLEISEI